MDDKSFDIIVIGAGHAACEAALAASRMGCSVMMIAQSLDGVAHMPCNPSIGGPAKGILVRELDALGGEQALAADESTLHLRWLNTSKGPAVRALRAQCDLRDYSSHYERALLSQAGLRVYQATVDEIVVEEGCVRGVVTSFGERFEAPRVVLAAGTYMRGRVFIGTDSFPSGPLGRVNAERISGSLERIGIRLVRFRTDTTPRISRRSIDWDSIPRQNSDLEAQAFSHWGEKRAYDGYFCGVTRTNTLTHDILRASFDRSPLGSKSVTTKGPRYCPSIDDKVIRFPERESHPIFLEPVGRSSDEVYMQNFSTSMPPDVQLKMVRTLPGCERALMLRPGYGIEYDTADPVQLEPWLETRAARGLYLAGQICGTSGYEEAGAQGLIAGINAALAAKGLDPLVLGRSDAYIGVLVDDITTRGTDEPYRMLPSRCEHRLIMRHDNADDRLCRIGHDIGLLSDDRYAEYSRRRGDMERERRRLESVSVRPTAAVNDVLKEASSSPLSEPMNALDLLLRPEVSWDVLARLIDTDLDAELGRKIEIERKYSGYAERESNMVRRLESMDRLVIPDAMDYGAISGLSAEASEKLSRVRPRTLGAAGRIPGVNGVDVQLVHTVIERMRRGAAE